jgi:hypothetical protein
MLLGPPRNALLTDVEDAPVSIVDRGDGTSEYLVWTPYPRPWRRFSDSKLAIDRQEFDRIRRTFGP